MMENNDFKKKISNLSTKLTGGNKKHKTKKHKTKKHKTKKHKIN
mgnify:CR=1 FL=1